MKHKEIPWHKEIPCLLMTSRVPLYLIKSLQQTEPILFTIIPYQGMPCLQSIKKKKDFLTICNFFHFFLRHWEGGGVYIYKTSWIVITSCPMKILLLNPPLTSDTNCDEIRWHSSSFHLVIWKYYFLDQQIRHRFKSAIIILLPKISTVVNPADLQQLNSFIESRK